MTIRYPDLGFMVGMDTPPLLRGLLLAASDRCRPIACSAVEPTPEPAPPAYLWCDSSARPPDGTPYAAWVGDADALHNPVVAEATVLLCASMPLLEEVREVVGDRALFVPSTNVDPDARPMTPFVRRRLRAERRLPADAIARGTGTVWYWCDAPEPLSDDLIATAAGAAAAVVASGPALATALLWAAPVATDPVSARRLGAVDGEHVLIARDPHTRLARARDLAADDATAARLGSAGRLLARERVDVAHAAWSMLARLGLPTHPLAGRRATLEHQLDLLGTPEYSSVRTRLRALVDPLPGHLSVEGAI